MDDIEQILNRMKAMQEQKKHQLDCSYASRLRILSLGDDEALLSTRHMVLESAGYCVRSITTWGIIEEDEVRGIDLALICHSVERDRATAIARSLKGINPRISIRQLSNGWVGRIDNVEQIVPDGPRQLLVQIEDILRGRFNTPRPMVDAARHPTAT